MPCASSGSSNVDDAIEAALEPLPVQQGRAPLAAACRQRLRPELSQLRLKACWDRHTVALKQLCRSGPSIRGIDNATPRTGSKSA